MEYGDLIGACGDNCSCCPRYKASAKNDDNELARIKDLWISLGLKEPNTNSSEMKCSGCHKENKCAYEKLRNCVFENSLNNCGMCTEYPCKITEEAFNRTGNLFASFDKSSITTADLVVLEKSFANKKSNLDKINTTLFKKGIEK